MVERFLVMLHPVLCVLPEGPALGKDSVCCKLVLQPGDLKSPVCLVPPAQWQQS